MCYCRIIVWGEVGHERRNPEVAAICSNHR
jgi:hypothetical protein